MLPRILLASLLLFAVPLAWSDAPTTSLRVKVMTLSGKPIDRASVVVRFVEGRSIVKLGKKQMTNYELRTNQEGIAKIPPIPQGKLHIMVIAKGYQTYGDYVQVDEEERLVEIKLNPPQPQYSAH
jgi:uncharacterized GH25 family protein